MIVDGDYNLFCQEYFRQNYEKLLGDYTDVHPEEGNEIHTLKYGAEGERNTLGIIARLDYLEEKFYDWAVKNVIKDEF